MAGGKQQSMSVGKSLITSASTSAEFQKKFRLKYNEIREAVSAELIAKFPEEEPLPYLKPKADIDKAFQAMKDIYDNTGIGLPSAEWDALRNASITNDPIMEDTFEAILNFAGDSHPEIETPLLRKAPDSADVKNGINDYGSDLGVTANREAISKQVYSNLQSVESSSAIIEFDAQEQIVSPEQTTTNVQAKSDIGAKKADIERRRQEELDSVVGSKLTKSALEKANKPSKTKEEAEAEIERVKKENKDLIDKLEDPNTSQEEWDRLADELEEKFRGTSNGFRFNNGKIEFYYESVKKGNTININYSNSSPDKVGKYEVGDLLSVSNGSTTLPATVTKVSKTGRILEAKANNGEIVISNGVVLSANEVFRSREINAKYDAELAALEQIVTPEQVETQEETQEEAKVAPRRRAKVVPTTTSKFESFSPEQMVTRLTELRPTMNETQQMFVDIIVDMHKAGENIIESAVTLYKEFTNERGINMELESPESLSLITKEQATDLARSIVPGIPTDVLNNEIGIKFVGRFLLQKYAESPKSVVVGRTLEIGQILLGEESGKVYKQALLHELLHYIYRNLMDENEQIRFMQSAKRKYGKAVQGMTTDQLEDHIAKDWVNWFETNERPSSNFFNRVLEAIKKFLEAINPFRKELNDYFKDFAAGAYAQEKYRP